MAIRVGVIGAGTLGRTHIASLSSFSDVVIAAVCDNDRSLAEEAAAPFEAKVHINFRTVIEEERLDAVFVCVPAFSHGEPETVAARAGVHLFVEPPLALNAQKAREVQKEIEKAGVVAAVGYCWRYLSGADTLRELLKDRKVAMVNAWRFLEAPPAGWRRRKEASGGLFLQSATELIDVARYLIGEVTTVSAMEYSGVAAATVPDCDIEDAVCVTLGFRSGAIGSIVCQDVPPYKDEVGITVVAEGLEATLDPVALEVAQEGRVVAENHVAPGLREAHGAFLKAVRKGKSGLIRSTYADAVTTLDAALAVRESIQTGKMISL